jgi:mannose-6-phosphate isomerase-like protein (cupin superfamily)
MIINTAISKHYKWGENCDGWSLVENGGLSVKEEQMPAGTSEQLHYHEKAGQFFYILSGILVFEVEGERLTVNEKSGIYIDAGKKHRVMNMSESSVRFLVISQPSTAEDRMNIK